MRLVIESSVREAGTDPIFAVSAKAKEAIKQVGADNVINSTIGALMDDEGNLVTFDEVYKTFKALPDDEIANYADIGGIPEFLDKVIDACFMDCRPEGTFIKAVATPGGTGAIRHAVANYTNLGDKILLPDWHWAPYQTIAQENRRDYDTFELYDRDGRFNFESYEKKFEELYQKQGRVLSILNTPALNPTGFSINIEEWKKLISFWTEEAEANPNKPIILLIDIAYIDFSKTDSREFMKLLTGLPENVLVLYAFSASKGYSMYGLRNGALICSAMTEDAADEFEASAVFSNRGTWSNGTRGAMKTLTEILSDEERYQRFKTQQDAGREMLQKRAKALVEEAERVGLPINTYDDGFFLSIPCNDPKAVAEKLFEDNIYLVALKNGLRVAICAISEEKCRKIPERVKHVIDQLE